MYRVVIRNPLQREVLFSCPARNPGVTEFLMRVSQRNCMLVKYQSEYLELCKMCLVKRVLADETTNIPVIYPW